MITIDAKKSVAISDFNEVVHHHEPVKLTADTKRKIKANRKFLEKQVKQEKVIYGVTSGFGPLANRFISSDQASELQENLVRMVSTGIGDPMPAEHVRASLLGRYINLSKGYSGVTQDCILQLEHFLNHNIIPYVPKLGTVGASGDLSPLAQIALTLMGEGTVYYDGKLVPTHKVLKKLKISPLRLQSKEGLALINGTSVMTGIATINSILVQKAIKLSMVLSSLYVELQNGLFEAFHPLFYKVRPHKGQAKVTDYFNLLLKDSKLIHRDTNFNKSVAEADQEKMIQDVYSIRCIPQILGAIYDVAEFHEGITLIELNAVTDNPIIFHEEELILSGGNFMGSHIALASDALSNAIINLAIHAERKIARIVDPMFNNGLPPYLQGKEDGLNSGFMSGQVSATSVVTYMRSISAPASIQSIPTNGNNQDVVSVGTIAAQKANELLHYLFDLMSIEAMMLVQAYELSGGFQKNTFSQGSNALAKAIREQADFVEKDRPLYSDFKTVAKLLKSDTFEKELDKQLGIKSGQSLYSE